MRRSRQRGGHVLPVVNPADERTVSELEESDATVVDRAVRAARRAFNEGPWPRMEVASARPSCAVSPRSFASTRASSPISSA